MKKRLLAWILALFMLVSLFPVSAFAEEEQNDEETAAAAEETVESDLPETADYEMAGPAVPQSEEEAGSEVLADAAVEGQGSGSDYTAESIPEDEETTQTGYTVSFDLRGHGETIEAVTIQEGETLARPADPAADGFVFGGWYSDADCSSRFDFEQTVITEDLTLYAGWTEEAPEAEETEPEAEYPAFEQVRTINGVTVTVKAGEGVFPAGAELSVEQVPVYQAVEDAVEAERDGNRTVAVSYTFDIKVINPETWEEYQPADGQTVSVSFALAEVADENLETNIYHVTEDEDSGAMTAESLEVTQEITPETGEETTAVVETEGFSYYQVEFTYEKKQYVLPGDQSVALSEILETVGLNGEATDVTVSTPELFSADLVNDEWIVKPLQAFTSEEWIIVTINDVDYEIIVTDAVVHSGNWGNLEWSLDSEGTLTISGTGPMNDFSYYSSSAWRDFSEDIKSVVLNFGVTSIGECAFPDCTSLKSITLPASLTIIGGHSFYGCSGLKSFTLPENLTSIGNYAFYHCSGLESITLLEGVTSIGNYAFQGCSSLTSITLPASLTSIGDHAFDSCFKLKTAGPIKSESNIKLGWTEVIPAKALCSCHALESITIPEGVTSIGDAAFEECDWLKSVTLPGSVASIGDNAFEYCGALESITFPGSVTSIGDEAFRYCYGLESITFLGSVTSIGDEAFEYCNGLKTAGPIGSGCDYEFGWTEAIPANAFAGCYELTSIALPGSVTSIGDHAFNGCNMTSITLPENLTSIGEGAFWCCDGLESIMLPEGVTSIGDWAFYDCTGLTSITLSENLTSIGEGAFCWCDGLESITLPESVTNIGDYAFSGCSKLTSITFPNSVISIGSNAFSGGNQLSVILFQGSPPSISSDAFADVTADAYYPSNKGWTPEDMQDYGGILTWQANILSIYALTNNQSIIVQFGKAVSGCDVKDNYIVTDSNGTVYPLSYAGSAYGETHTANTFKLNFYDPLPADVFHIETQNMSEVCEGDFEILLNLSVYRFVDRNNVIIQLNEPIIGCTTAENYVMHTLSGEEIKITSAVSAFQEIGGEAPNVFRLTTAKALQAGTTYVVETRGMSWHGEECQGTIAYFTPEVQVITIHALTNNQSIIVKYDKEVNGCTEKDNYIVTGSNGTVYPLSYAGSAYSETHTANTFKLNFHSPLPADVFHIRTQNMSESCEGEFEILLNLSVYRFVDKNNVIIQLNEPIIGCTTAENYVMHTLSGEEIKITSAVSAFQEIGGEAANVFRLTTAKDLQRGTTYVVETRGMSWNGQECQGTIAYITP